MYKRTIGWVLGLVIVSCGPVVATDGGSTGGVDSTVGPTSDPEASASVADEVTSSTPGTTASTSTTTATTASTSTDSTATTQEGTFIPGGDWGGESECSLWLQDCPRGEKCMPWANDGGSSWNATRCSPIEPDPRAVGEPCTVEGSSVSGIDDCELGAMCWNVDPETNMGECVAFCVGDEANPSCANECDNCHLTNEGVLILCLPECDPIAQDCGEGMGCYPDYESFSCFPDASGEGGGVGEPCEFLNGCSPGMACVGADLLPACEGVSGCCSPFCAVDGPPICEDAVPGTSCVAWWEGGQPAKACIGPATIGVCGLPP